MKATSLFICAVLLMTLNAWSQTPIDNTNDGYSKWLFLQSDKALQVRYKQVKEEGDIAHFQVQVKTNFDDKIFCKHPTCLGYLMVFGYRTPDNNSKILKSYKFYNSYKDVYTFPETIPVKMSFPDGSKRYLRQEGFFYTVDGNSTEQRTSVFSACVDNILSDDPEYHRCKSRDEAFKESEAIVLK